MEKKYKNKKQLLKFILVFITLSLIVITPLINTLVARHTKAINVPEWDSDAYEIVAGDSITQDIFIENGLKKVAILMGNDGRTTNKGNIKISILQNNKIESQEFDIKSVGNWSYIQVSVDYSKFVNGKATIKIESENTKAGESVYFKFKKYDTESDLPEARLNGKSMPGALCINYDVYTNGPDYNYSLILLMPICLICCILSYILTFKDDKDDKEYIFIFTTILIFLVCSFKYPMLSFKAEAWAEAAEHFYDVAKNQSIISSLFSLEGNMYVSMFSALISTIAVKFLFLGKYYILFVQLLAISFFSICSSIFCLRYFERYFCNIVRILFSIFIGINLFYDEHISFIQVQYMGIFFIIAFCMYELENLSKFKYIIICIITIIICLSKMNYVALIPSSIMGLLLFWNRISARKRNYLLLISISCFIEGALSLILKKIYAPPSLWGNLGKITFLPLQEFINKTCYYLIQVLYSVLIRRNDVRYSSFSINVILFLAFALLIITNCYNVFYKKNREVIGKVILIMCTLSISQCGMMLLSNAGIDAVNNISWNKNLTMYQSRFFMFGYVGIIFILVMLFYTFKDYLSSIIIEKKKNSFLIMLEVGLALYCVVLSSVQYATNGSINYNEEFSNSELVVSDWKNYSKYLNNNSYSISISPKGWFLNKNSTVETLNKDVNMYNSIKLDSINDKKIIAVYARKYEFTNQIADKTYTMIMYDNNNNEVMKVKQINASYKKNIGFILETPISNVSRIEFVYGDGKIAYLQNELFIAREN